MPAYFANTPQTGVAFVTYIALRSQADSTTYKASPTLAAGDFKVSIDGGALANLSTLPTNTPAGSKLIKISLSAAEMTGDNITVQCSDAAGAEWFDEVLNIPTSQYRSIVVDVNGVADANAAKVGGQTASAAGAVTFPSTIASLVVAMTESYSADGGTMTVAQALYEIKALLSEFSVSGTTLTTKKVDGSTPAATYTLDSATTPTSITRAT